ncbi:MAG: ABC transporter permease [Chloroflexota bacterium]|nr:ABC transporter permease [Chloroflexota bacterium]
MIPENNLKPSPDFTAAPDERLRRESGLRKLLRRPELGAVGGAVLVWLFFAIVAGDRGFLTLRGTANYLEVAAELGILAVGVALLMIAGEFDLSVGSVIGGAGMITAILSVELGWNIWAAIAVSLLASLAIGAINGVLVNRTRLPSFIITLATLFIVRGLTVGITRLITGRTQIGGLDAVPGFDSAAAVFASAWGIVDPTSARGVTANFSVSILWWAIAAAIATYVLLRTRPGNWIFGIGGDENAARGVGVPVARMRVALFMVTAFSAWLVATIQVLSSGGADTLRGEGREFYAIIAVVIGGTLLTGGYGSAIGAVFGALIFGMVQQGIVFTGVDSDWFLMFMGTMLIIAVLVNNFIRKQAAEAK